MTAAKDILFCVLERTNKEVEDIAKEEGTSDKDAIRFINEVNVPYGNITHQLFVWSTTDKVVAGCTSMATSVEAAELEKQLQEAFAPHPPAREAPQIPRRHINPSFCAVAETCLA